LVAKNLNFRGVSLGDSWESSIKMVALAEKCPFLAKFDFRLLPVAYITGVGKAIDRRFPLQTGLVLQKSVKGKRRIDRNRRGSSNRHVDVRRYNLRGGGEFLGILFDQEDHEVELFLRSPNGSDSQRDGFSTSHFGKVSNVLFEDKTAGVFGFKIVERQSDRLKELDRGSSEQMGVPHHVHVAHEIDPVLRDRNCCRRSQVVPVGRIEFNHVAALYWVLPVEIKSAGEDIGVGRSKDRLFAGNRMDPVKHHSHAVAPVPIYPKREVVVLARIEIV
jgi:hypothetical protein